MELHKISTPDKGFTIIEVLIMLGIFAIIVGIGVFVGFDFYKSYSFISEKNIIVSVLQKARNQSLNNINQMRHGVRFQENPLQYIIFQCPISKPQCTDYSASSQDIFVDASYAISFISPSPSLPFNIIFDQLNGDCINCSNPETTIRVSDGIKSYDITINSEGRVNW